MDEKVDRQKRYFESEKGKEARRRASRAQAEKRAANRKRAAEEKRVDKLVAGGVLESMSASDKRQWLERCRDENPLMYDVLREKGVH